MWRWHSTHAHSVTPPLTSTVKSLLFTHAHSSPLLAARLHRCCSNCSCYVNNGWTFSRQTSDGINYAMTSLAFRRSMLFSQDHKEHTCIWTNLVYYLVQWGIKHAIKNWGVVSKKMLERTYYRLWAGVRFWRSLRKWDLALALDTVKK